MLLSATLHATGFVTDLSVNGEAVIIGAQSVAAIVNREPRFYDMQDAGYIDKEPVVVEVLQGGAADSDSVWIQGKSVPLSLRGVTPQNLQHITVDGVVRKIVKLQNAQDRWIVTTIKINTAANTQPNLKV